MEGHRTAIIYVRVSTSKQIGNEDAKYTGPGLNAQEKVCLRHYKRLFPKRKTLKL